MQVVSITEGRKTGSRAPTIKDIQGWLADCLLKETGAKVEVTMCGKNKWSLCGMAEDAEKAMRFLAEKRIGTETDRATDDELPETFIYFTTGVA